jgi:hypothetical protein
MFGLGVAYDMVGNAEIRSEISLLVTRMLDFLIAHGWFVVMPDGSISTTFVTNPDQRLSFLIVGRRVNSLRFSSIYESERLADISTVGTAVYFDLLDDHSSYFKFNLDTINLYNLIRLEGNVIFRANYMQVYNVLRRTTEPGLWRRQGLRPNCSSGSHQHRFSLATQSVPPLWRRRGYDRNGGHRLHTALLDG